MEDVEYCPRCQLPVIRDDLQTNHALCAHCFYSFCIECRESWHPVIFYRLMIYVLMCSEKAINVPACLPLFCILTSINVFCLSGNLHILLYIYLPSCCFLYLSVTYSCVCLYTPYIHCFASVSVLRKFYLQNNRLYALCTVFLCRTNASVMKRDLLQS